MLFWKMFLQKKKGIQTDQIGKGKTGRSKAIELINASNPGDGYIKIKSLEAFSKAADGQSTKIIIPSEIQGLAGLAEGVVESVRK